MNSLIAGPFLSTQTKSVLQKDATDFNGCNTVELKDTHPGYVAVSTFEQKSASKIKNIIFLKISSLNIPNTRCQPTWAKSVSKYMFFLHVTFLVFFLVASTPLPTFFLGKHH